jgi:DNA polymerase III delta subunit
MLYLIYGKNTYLSRNKVREITGVLLTKNKNAAFWRFTPDNADEEKLKQVLADQDLFGRKLVVLFEGLFEAYPEFFLKNLKTAADSPNAYIILEEEMASRIVKKIGKYAQKIQEFGELDEKELKKWLSGEIQKRKLNLKPEEIRAIIDNSGGNLWALDRILEFKSLGADSEINNFNYNPFELADLFVKKKRREAYVCFHKNLAGGVAKQELFWKLWWQIKTVIAVSNYKKEGLNSFEIKQKTGFHPFVIQKASSALLNFNPKELEKIWDELFSIWIDSRIGISDLSQRLEYFLMKNFAAN